MHAAFGRPASPMRKRGGFTVMEMLVAVSLATLIFYIIMSGFYMAHDLTSRARAYIEANQQMRAAFRQLKEDLLAAREDSSGQRGIFICAHSSCNPDAVYDEGDPAEPYDSFWNWTTDTYRWGMELQTVDPERSNLSYPRALAYTPAGSSILMFRTGRSLAGAGDCVVMYYVRDQYADMGYTRKNFPNLPEEFLPLPIAGKNWPSGHGRRGILIRAEYDLADWNSFNFAPPPGVLTSVPPPVPPPGHDAHYGPCRCGRFHLPYPTYGGNETNGFKVRDILWTVLAPDNFGSNPVHRGLSPRREIAIAENVLCFRVRCLSEKYLLTTDYSPLPADPEEGIQNVAQEHPMRGMEFRTWGVDNANPVDWVEYDPASPQAPADPFCWNSRSSGTYPPLAPPAPHPVVGFAGAYNEPYMADRIPGFAEVYLKLTDYAGVLCDHSDKPPAEMTAVFEVKQDL